MKKNALLLACLVLFSSCHKSKPEIVNDFLDAINNPTENQMDKLLSDNFMYYGKDTLNKNEYLTELDSLKTIEYKSNIQKIQDLDSIVKTEETVSSIIDSLLEVTPKIIQFKTYRFSNNELISVTVDSTMNDKEYNKELTDKQIPFNFYIKDKYDIEDKTELSKNIKKYLIEYVSLPASDRKRYRIYGHLQGTYVSKNCAFYRKLIFRGKSTATIVDAIFGWSFTSSYEVDDNYVRIRTDKSDLLFEVKDNTTLIGEGFAKGTFTKK